MNQYPGWKYILIIMIVVVGAFYALPNLYGDNPAVQMSGEAGTALEAETIAESELALSQAGITPLGSEEIEGRVLYRFDNVDQQSRAAEVLTDRFGNRASVARNLAPATPDWLRAMGGDPMVLGLDLQGGIHFLLQVDMDSAQATLLERTVDGIRTALRAEGINYVSVQESGNGVRVSLRSAEDRERALAELRGAEGFEGLTWTPTETGASYAIQVGITEARLDEIRSNALEQNMSTLRTRVNEIGVAEPVVQQQGADRIVVQLPGIQDTARAKELLGATATLQYRAVDQENDPYAAARTGRVPPNSRLYYDRQGNPVLLKKQLIASGDQLVGASSGIDQQSGTPSVSVNLDSEGAASMLRFTRNNVGNGMAVVFIEQKPGEPRTEEVISIANIREPFGARFQTTGLDSSAEAAQLALLLRAGALAAPMEIIEERTVGPSLGQDNIDKGFRSVMIGFVVVLVFMAIYYKVFGLFANVALFLNLVLIVAGLSIIGATLTLPGIAGIVLTVGMAVDANVLIFERIREEIAVGSTPQASIRAGYEKAFSTIADANITTLIAAIVLFVFGTGPIKGFAVTLSIGIVTSMFTAIMVTRALANLTYGRRAKVEKLAI